VNAAVTLLRPLLDFSREEIVQYARDQAVEYRDDQSNRDTDIPRNWVREELLPLLLQFQPALLKVVSRNMELFQADAFFVEQFAAQWLLQQVPEHGKALPGCAPAFSAARPFSKQPVAIQRAVLRLQLLKLGVVPEFELLERLRDNAEMRVTMAGTRQVIRDVEGRVNLVKQSPGQHFNLEEQALDLERRRGQARFAGVCFAWAKVRSPRAKPPLGASQRNCEYFDATRVGQAICLRYWRPGDRFQPIGLARAAKLQDLFVNAKVSREERRRRVVAVAANGEIFWVEGLRIGERFKLDTQTRIRLKWCWNREEERAVERDMS
jgi:tRNA(Ile)-lysidine synthase